MKKILHLLRINKSVLSLLIVLLFFSFAIPMSPFAYQSSEQAQLNSGAILKNSSQNPEYVGVSYSNRTLREERTLTRLWHSSVIPTLTADDAGEVTPIYLPEGVYLEYSPDVKNELILGVNQNSGTNTKDGVNTLDASGNSVESASYEAYGASDIDTWVDAPAYWERGESITISVHFRNNGWSPFSYSGYIYCYIKDYYTDVPGGQWVTEKTASKYASFTLRAHFEYTVSISFYAPYTTPGLKKIVVSITGSLSRTLDMGYNFVQKYKSGELGTPTHLASDSETQLTEDPLEASDLFHLTDWTVIRRAGEAGDCWRRDATPIDVGYYIMDYVHTHFVYDKNYQSIPLGDYLTASDLWLINHRDSNGYYHGVCDEYSVLFASYARSLGMPARVILIWFAEGSTENQGHAFNEFWDGDAWIHADATFDVFNDPGYYKREFDYVYPPYITQGAHDSLSSKDDDNGYTTGILDQHEYYYHSHYNDISYYRSPFLTGYSHYPGDIYEYFIYSGPYVYNSTTW